MKHKNIFFFLCAFLIFETSCQKNNTPPPTTPVQVAIANNGYESKLDNWKVETDYKGIYGFKADTGAKHTGTYGLDFYVPQTSHWNGAPNETPWNGSIYQTISGLKDGTYTFKAYADAVGDGMYLWAQGDPEAPASKLKIKSSTMELNTLDFVVKGGTAKIGFICIDAGGTGVFAPYFHADDLELWTK